jgi:hypothetical protein
MTTITFKNGLTAKKIPSRGKINKTVLVSVNNHNVALFELLSVNASASLNMLLVQGNAPHLVATVQVTPQENV